MANYNYGTAINRLIDYYKEMLELIIHARLASDRIDEWKAALYLATDPDQTHTSITNNNHDNDRIQFYKDYL